MKTLTLIAKSIRYYYRCSRPIFFLFLIGLLSSSLLLIFLYGNLNPSVQAYSENDSYARKYVFSFSNIPNTEDVKKLLNRYSEPVSFIYMVSAPILKNNGEDERIYTLGCETLGTNENLRRIRGRNYFTDEELSEGKNVAIVSESAEFFASGSIMQLGKDTIRIHGVDFTVVGTASHIQCDIFIPETAFIKNGFPISAIATTLKEKPSYYENLDLLRDMREQFPDVSISGHPYSSYENSKRDTLSVMLVLSVVFAAAIAAFMFLLKYLSDSTDYIGAIQSICGAPKDTVVFIKLASVFLMTFSVSAVGVALHALLYGPVFSKLNTIQGLIYQPRDYLLILCMCCIAAVLVSVPFVVSFSRGSAAAFKRRLE